MNDENTTTEKKYIYFVQTEVLVTQYEVSGEKPVLVESGSTGATVVIANSEQAILNLSGSYQASVTGLVEQLDAVAARADA